MREHHNLRAVPPPQILDAARLIIKVDSFRVPRYSLEAPIGAGSWENAGRQRWTYLPGGCSATPPLTCMVRPLYVQVDYLRLRHPQDPGSAFARSSINGRLWGSDPASKTTVRFGHLTEIEPASATLTRSVIAQVSTPQPYRPQLLCCLPSGKRVSNLTRAAIRMSQRLSQKRR